MVETRQTPTRSRSRSRALSPLQQRRTPSRSSRSPSKSATPGRRSSSRARTPSRKAVEARKVVETTTPKTPRSRSRSSSTRRTPKSTAAEAPKRRSTTPKKATTTPKKTATPEKKKSPAPKSAAAKSTEKAATKAPEIDEFVGTLGAALMMILLPILVNFFWYSCSSHQCGVTDGISALRKLLEAKSYAKLFSTVFPAPSCKAWDITLLWIGGQWALHLLLPGDVVRGFPLPRGGRLLYRINGLSSYVVTCAAMVASFYYGWWDVASIVPLLGELLVCFHIVAYVLCLALYVKGRLSPGWDANPTGDVVKDYFYGYEMNPRLFHWLAGDFKFFFEGRALILWTVFDYCLCAAQFQSVGFVSRGLLLVSIFQSVYVFHYFWYESDVLGMIDFTAENMGWMLGWGNIVWVPFYYSLQALYIFHNVSKKSEDISDLHAIGSVALFSLGYLIFRQANRQKQDYRSLGDRARIWGKSPEVLKTKRGSGLLVCGWWGLARHMNYTGDLIIAFAFGVPCGFGGLVPYAYWAFLTYLLLQRESRDEQWCRQKYGFDWDRYCTRVRWRLIPYVY